MWIYSQSSGILWEPETHKKVAVGYSGHGEGRNNPALEHVKNVGPIPRGRYYICPAVEHEKLGPLSMRLYALSHDARGRTDFLIHGDNKTNDASHGCIILNRQTRQKIADSNDRDLLVID